MSARDDFPPSALLSGSASLYEALWAELDALREAVSEGPWVVYLWDSDADENRGMRREQGVYRTREAAQAECDRLNEPLLARLNARERSKYESDMDRWRSFQTDVMPVEPKPWRLDQFQEWARGAANDNPYDGKPCRRWPWLDHYYIETLEYDG